MISPQAILRETGIRPRKALGQNFLIHSASADKIANWSGVQSGDVVLEIGPGLGALTEALGRAGCNVTAVEKDARLFEHLKNTWADAPWLSLIHADALEIDLAALFSNSPTKPRVVANLPYSISTPILERLVNQRTSFESFSILLQEEVVERICSVPGNKNYGRLSIFLQVYCETIIGPRVPRGSFHPKPDVESRLLRLVPRSSPLVKAKLLPIFFEATKHLFQHRRKTVRNALKDAKKDSWKIDTALEKAGIDPGRRPETLSIADLTTLASALTTS